MEDVVYAVGLVGAEGFIGWPLVMGDDRSPYDVTMRAERDQALRIPAKALLAAIDRSPTLHLALLRSGHVFMLQMGRTVVSSLAHSIERRMARWILLYHDRVRGDEICMTHEELGVRRSSVTDALHRLEDEHAIPGDPGKGSGPRSEKADGLGGRYIWPTRAGLCPPPEDGPKTLKIFAR